MKDELATKKDIKTTQAGLETALKKTKTELESAIKETKKDLQGQINVVNWKMDRIDERLSNFQNESGQKLDTIITAVDGLAKMIADGQTEKVAVNSAL